MYANPSITAIVMHDDAVTLGGGLLGSPLVLLRAREAGTNIGWEKGFEFGLWSLG